MYYRTSQYPASFPLAAAYSLPILLTGLLVLVVQRVLLRDQARFVTGSSRGGRPLAINGWFAQASLLLHAWLTVLLPLAAIVVIVSLQPYWNRRIDVATFTWSIARRCWARARTSWRRSATACCSR